uniref:Uncharacterized protein n=1 Tax=Acrobeloides nanus TaxID=290746 RepID=A0A914EI62_9BILA
MSDFINTDDVLQYFHELEGLDLDLDTPQVYMESSILYEMSDPWPQPYDISMQGGFSMPSPSILEEANLPFTSHSDQQVPRENVCQFVSDTRAEMMDMTDANPPPIVITFRSMSTENIAFLQYPHLQNSDGNKGRRKIINPDSKTEKGCTSQTLHRHKLHRKLVQLIRQEICRQEVIDPTTVEFVLNQVEEVINMEIAYIEAQRQQK